MVLVEHDAKELLARYGVPIPRGVLLEQGGLTERDLPAGPWVVKAQVKAGGRGKGGLVRMASTLADVQTMSAAMLGTTFKGKTVTGVRVEEQLKPEVEAYVAFLVDPVKAGIRVIVAKQGGIDIETAPEGSVRSMTVGCNEADIAGAVATLAAGLPAAVANALGSAATKLAKLFVESEALLVEINPLFVMAQGEWIAADAKVIIDDNALGRQPYIAKLVATRGDNYADEALKEAHGFDFVVVDPEGDVGLVTTGAGLSMMLIDEMRLAGLRPYNFMDIRTGGFRGDPARLITVFEWFASNPYLRVVLINIFAGITDLGEFAHLLVEARRRVPAFSKKPVVTRLVGTRVEGARAVLAEAGIEFHSDLDRALESVRQHLA